ncbi:unnamed protein product [Mytilus coruscus]|uniref:Uncharacterized protein n=1 Tax=Mytilus coruscus TaxID=42192 RepID=A0A6J8BRZ3_MYTCO|nr:unnamed protein product [Mytilus coruscus]
MYDVFITEEQWSRKIERESLDLQKKRWMPRILMSSKLSDPIKEKIGTRILMKELQTSELSEVQQFNKDYAHNNEALEKKKFRLAGQLVVMSLEQGGSGIHYINETLAAVRRNNSPLILASRMRFALLFYSLNMTNCQELHNRDTLMQVNMPPDVKTLIDHNQSFSSTGHPSKGEGGDFILDAQNRTKMRMAPGIPTEDRW